MFYVHACGTISYTVTENKFHCCVSDITARADGASAAASSLLSTAVRLTIRLHNRLHSLAVPTYLKTLVQHYEAARLASTSHGNSTHWRLRLR